MDGSKLIGHKTSLTYKVGKGKAKKKTDWVMHEFQLHCPSDTLNLDDRVICRIHNKNLDNSCIEHEEPSHCKDGVSVSVLADGENEDLEEVVGNLVKRRQVEKTELMSSMSLPETEACNKPKSVSYDVGSDQVASSSTSIIPMTAVHAPSSISVITGVDHENHNAYPFFLEQFLLYDDSDFAELPPWDEMMGNFGQQQLLGDVAEFHQKNTDGETLIQRQSVEEETEKCPTRWSYRHHCCHWKYFVNL